MTPEELLEIEVKKIKAWKAYKEGDKIELVDLHSYLDALDIQGDWCDVSVAAEHAAKTLFSDDDIDGLITGCEADINELISAVAATSWTRALSAISEIMGLDAEHVDTVVAGRLDGDHDEPWKEASVEGFMEYYREAVARAQEGRP